MRTKEEFDLEHSEDKKILLVCRSGSRAEMAKTFLKEKGFLNVENGGEWDNWK